MSIVHSLFVCGMFMAHASCIIITVVQVAPNYWKGVCDLSHTQSHIFWHAIVQIDVCIWVLDTAYSNQLIFGKSKIKVINYIWITCCQLWCSITMQQDPLKSTKHIHWTWHNKNTSIILEDKIRIPSLHSFCHNTPYPIPQHNLITVQILLTSSFPPWKITQ